MAAIEAIAFSRASRVITCDGLTSRRRRSIASRPASSAASFLAGANAGMPFSPAGLIPRKSSAVDIVFAVNWPPHAPAPGQATPSSSWSSPALMFPTACAPTASKTS